MHVGNIVQGVRMAWAQGRDLGAVDDDSDAAKKVRNIGPCLYINSKIRPRAGSKVVRIDPLRFLAGCRTRRLNQVWLCLTYILACFIVLLFIRAPFYVLLVFVAMCSVFWLFWLSYQYLSSDWLERPL